MAWSITIDELSPGDTQSDPMTVFGPATVERLLRENVEYPFDAIAAMRLAEQRGFRSCTITGMRTPTPGSDDEVIDISVRGLLKAGNFNEAIRNIIKAGPDAPE
jgi:hypothetical protein